VLSLRSSFFPFLLASGVGVAGGVLGGSLSQSLARKLRPIILIVDGDCLGRLNDSKNRSW